MSEHTLVATPPAEPVVEAQIEHMVQRFLQWKLPESFNPDGGVSFDKSYRSPHGPVGTNLFDATQADAMVRHMLEDLPALATKSAVKDDETVVEALVEALKDAEDVLNAFDHSGYSQSDVLATIRSAIAKAEGR